MNGIHMGHALLALMLGAGWQGHALSHGETPGASGMQQQQQQHQRHDHGTVGETDFGRPGDPKKVTRTIRVDMDDTFRYAPKKLAIRKGETVRIVGVNHGKLLHEIVIGTDAELALHAESMKKAPGMQHGSPHMAHVAPGKSAAIVWQFTQAGEFKYGCLVAGHFEAGMIGDIVVR